MIATLEKKTNAKPVLYRLQLLAGTHTQDELFLLTDEQLYTYVKRTRCEIPEGFDRREVIGFLIARGHGQERTYYRGEEFISQRDLAKKFPNKIGRIAGGPVTNPELQMQPGETLAEFAARITEMANRQAGKQETKKTVNDDIIDSIDKAHVTTNKLPPLSLPVAFEKMSVEELKDYAADREIDLDGATTRADMVYVLQEYNKTANGG